MDSLEEDLLGRWSLNGLICRGFTWKEELKRLIGKALTWKVELKWIHW